VRRILVAGWGAEASAYVGRRMTIYRDPAVRFGGQDVGGIRISHMSDLDKPLKIALTVTRGKRAAHIVQPLADDAPTAPPLDETTVAKLAELRAEWDGADQQRRAEIKAEVDALSGGAQS
jgi:hypothetical protein